MARGGPAQPLQDKNLVQHIVGGGEDLLQRSDHDLGWWSEAGCEDALFGDRGVWPCVPCWARQAAGWGRSDQA